MLHHASSLSSEAQDDACREAAEKSHGAILLAVMRGRSSEGVDFLDACARAVLVVGIPYPPLYDVTVRLKRAFNHEHQAMLGSGDDWYAAEAFRAVNQAVGESQQHKLCEEPRAFMLSSPEAVKLSCGFDGRVCSSRQQFICYWGVQSICHVLYRLHLEQS